MKESLIRRYFSSIRAKKKALKNLGMQSELPSAQVCAMFEKLSYRQLVEQVKQINN